LKEPDRVVGREDRHGSAEADVLRTRGNRAKDRLGRGNREIVAVMFAKAEIVEPDLIGEHRLFHHIADHMILRIFRSVGREGHVTEGVERKFKGHGSGPGRVRP
jgi:hypothetical protein